MGSETPVFALIAISTIVAFAIVGSLLIEPIVGRQHRYLDPFDSLRMRKVSAWWAALWLGVILLLVVIIQVAMVAALVDPAIAPLTRVVAATEILCLVGWGVAVARFHHGPDI